MGDGDIAFKSNFATWNPETGIVEQRRADRRFEDLGPLFCSDMDGTPLGLWATSTCLTLPILVLSVCCTRGGVAPWVCHQISLVLLHPAV